MVALPHDTSALTFVQVRAKLAGQLLKNHDYHQLAVIYTAQGGGFRVSEPKPTHRALAWRVAYGLLPAGNDRAEHKRLDQEAPQLGQQVADLPEQLANPFVSPGYLHSQASALARRLLTALGDCSGAEVGAADLDATRFWRIVKIHQRAMVRADRRHRACMAFGRLLLRME